VTRDSNNGVQRRYSSPLRESQAQITVRRILEATADLLITKGPNSITHAGISRHAQLAERTVYRHFPDKETLWAAFTDWLVDTVGDGTQEALLLPALKENYTRFSQHEQLLRHFLGSKEFLSRTSPSQEKCQAYVEEHVPGLNGHDPGKLEMAASIIRFVTGAPGWASLCLMSDFTVEQAVKAAEMSVNALLLGLRSGEL